MSSKSSPRSKPNIRMVAERVQLSPATVSLALRGSASIAADTRARVLAAAQELNYVLGTRAGRPTREQAALQPYHFLFLAKDFGESPMSSNPFHGEILSAAERECATHGARLTFTMLPDLEQTSEQLAGMLANYRADGLLLVGAYAPAMVRQIATFVQAPVVLVDNMVPGSECDSVMADDIGGGQLATLHLIERGHQHIAALVGDLSSPSFLARYHGYCTACLHHGLEVAAPTTAIWDRQALRQALEQVFARTPRPTAIFCVTDAYAVFVMELLRDMGLQVPQDVSVVGFDDFPIARMAHPPLTTLHNHPDMLGKLAIQRLLARMAGESTPGLNITVATQLVVRESTAMLAS